MKQVLYVGHRPPPSILCSDYHFLFSAKYTISCLLSYHYLPTQEGTEVELQTEGGGVVMI